jgi:hypothetical protein
MLVNDDAYRNFFRRNGQPRNFVLFTFCALIAIAIERNKLITHVIIDREYPGHEPVIKNILLEMIGRNRTIDISFMLIGKKSPAHFTAYGGAIGKLRIDAHINSRHILDYIKKTEVGKRLKDM